MSCQLNSPISYFWYNPNSKCAQRILLSTQDFFGNIWNHQTGADPDILGSGGGGGAGGGGGDEPSNFEKSGQEKASELCS